MLKVLMSSFSIIINTYYFLFSIILLIFKHFAKKVQCSIRFEEIGGQLYVLRYMGTYAKLQIPN